MRKHRSLSWRPTCLLRAYPKQPHRDVAAAVQSERSPQTLPPKLKSIKKSPVPARAPQRRTLGKKPGARLHFPSVGRKAHHRNSFVAVLHPNTVSSSTSELSIHPRKLS